MPDADVDLARLGADLQTTFPQLGVVTPARVLGSGFRSVVVATREGWAFRIAKNAAATAGQAKEARLLPALGPWLPVPVPDPRWHAGPSARFPFGVLGYRLLPGVPLDPAHLARADGAEIAAGVAAFLRALQKFPPAEALALGLPGPAARRARWEQMHAVTVPYLRAALPAAEYDTLARWWDTLLTDPRMEDYTPVLTHGDLWYENLLVDAELRALTGVLDFEDAGVGDPAQDFATLRHLGAAFTAQVINAFRAAGGTFDPGFAHRLDRLWELREFDGLAFALEIEDQEEIEDAIRKLRRRDKR